MKLKVALLTGGISSEDYLSRRSGALILENANQERYEFSLFDWNKDGSVDEYAAGDPHTLLQRHANILSAFAVPKKFDLVFNALHGELECDGQIQGLLELAKQPFTGNGKLSSVLGMNKILSKKIFREAGFRTAELVSFSKNDAENFAEKCHMTALKFDFPLVVKAATGGSSNSVFAVTDESGMIACIQNLLIEYDEVFVEPFLEGSEYTVAVFGDKNEKPLITLPAARIGYEGAVLDSVIKKNDRYSVLIPCGLSEEDQQALRTTAEKIHSTFNFNAFSRVDFRYSKGVAYVLEVNTHPGFGPNSIVPNMLKAANISWKTAIDWMIDSGLRAHSN